MPNALLIPRSAPPGPMYKPWIRNRPIEAQEVPSNPGAALAILLADVLAGGDLDSDRGVRRGLNRVGSALVIGAAYGEVVANVSVVDVSRWQ